MKNSTIRNVFNNRTFAMIMTYALPMASFAGLSYLGVLESWGFYILFLLFPLAYILMMESLHPTPQKVIAHKNLRKDKAGR